MDLTNKENIRKIIVIFFIFMIVMTVLSRTISKWLLPVVEVSQVFSGTLEHKVMQDGYIGIDIEDYEKEPIVLWSPISGTINNINLEQGQIINKGDVLIEYKNEVNSSKDKEKDLEIEIIKSQGNALTREYNFMTTKMEQLDIEITDLKEKESNIMYDPDVVDLKSQQDELRKQQEINKVLYDSDIISKQEYDQISKELDILGQKYNNLIKIKKKNIQENVKKLQLQKEELDKSKLDLKEQIVIINRQKDIKESNKNISQYSFCKDGKIIAPVNAIVQKVHCYTDVFIEKGDNLLSIIPSNMEILAYCNINQEQAQWIEVGDSVTIVANSKLSEGKIIEKQYRPDTKQYRLKAEINNELKNDIDLEFYNQIPCQITCIKESQVYEWILPISAITEEMGETYIYIIEHYKSLWGKGYKANKVPVTLLDDNKYYGAVDMIIPKDAQIIEQSSVPLKEGMEVRIE